MTVYVVMAPRENSWDSYDIYAIYASEEMAKDIADKLGGWVEDWIIQGKNIRMIEDGEEV